MKYTTFEEVWDKIDGEKKSLPEVLRALDKEISQRERISGELNRARDFKSAALVDHERDSFTQVRYGILDLPYLGEPEKLRERDLEESAIWKAERAKRAEMEKWVKDGHWQSNQDIKFGDIGKDREAESETPKERPRHDRGDKRGAREAGNGAQGNQRGSEGVHAGANPDAVSSRAKQAQEAQKEKAEAQRAEEIISGAASIPRGMDSNLPNAALNFEQEAILSSIDKAGAEIKGMRASASEKETAAASSPVADAISAAKRNMGPGAIVTNAQAGKTYTGKIIGVTGTHPDTIAIQKISGNQAVLHRIKDISAETNIQVGADVSIARGKNGKATVRTREELDRDEKTKEYGERERER